MRVHPTAIIEDGAKIGANATIGAYCVVGRGVTLGDNVTLHSHAVVGGLTEIGEGSEIYPFASLGSAPQDLKYKGEKSRLVIGRHCKIREHVTMNPGTEGGGMITRVGDYCLFMVGAHVAHDCQVGDHVILANNATLAGHVTIGDHVVIGGLSAVHQFVRIGAHAMIGGMSGVENDVIPYGSVVGERAWLAGLNLVGLKRRNFAREEIHALRNAFKALFEDANHTLAERIDKIKADYTASSTVMDVINFVDAKSSRALCLPRRSLEDEAA